MKYRGTGDRDGRHHAGWVSCTRARTSSDQPAWHINRPFEKHVTGCFWKRKIGRLLQRTSVPASRRSRAEEPVLTKEAQEAGLQSMVRSWRRSESGTCARKPHVDASTRLAVTALYGYIALLCHSLRPHGLCAGACRLWHSSSVQYAEAPCPVDCKLGDWRTEGAA